jgi:hypothetical protein
MAMKLTLLLRTSLLHAAWKMFLICLFILCSMVWSSCCTDRKIYNKIESIQKAAIDKLPKGSLDRFFIKDSAIAFIEKTIKWNLSQGIDTTWTPYERRMTLRAFDSLKLVSKYQDGYTYDVYAKSLNQIDKAARTIGYTSKSYKPKFATVFSADFNIDVRHICNERVIFISEGTFEFISSATEQILLSIPSQALDELREGRIYTKTELKSFITNQTIKTGLLNEALKFISGTVMTHRNDIPWSHAQIIGQLLTSQQNFVLAHEYSHVVKKHTLSGFYFKSELMNSPGDSLLSKKKLLKSLSNELHADNFAQIAIQAVEDQKRLSHYQQMNYLGGFLFLTFEKFLAEINRALHNVAPEDTVFLSMSTDSTVVEYVKYYLRGAYMSKKDISDVKKDTGLYNEYKALAKEKMNYNRIPYYWLNRSHPPTFLRLLRISIPLSQQINALQGRLSKSNLAHYEFGVNLMEAMTDLFDQIIFEFRNKKQ